MFFFADVLCANGRLRCHLALFAAAALASASEGRSTPADGLQGTAVPGPNARMKTAERQITRSRKGHILTNTGVWSPDGEWIVYDTRSDPVGERFDGNDIEMVNVRSGEVKSLFRSVRGAHCGVVTFNPRRNQVAFILGPEDPTPEWQYGPSHRQGVIVDADHPGRASNLDARDLTPPFTAGALRGGSHVHVWEPAGEWISFTYEDHLLSAFNEESVGHEVKGLVAPLSGTNFAEVFVVDLPTDLTLPGEGPLAGTETRRPFPPRGTSQRRLTFTANRKYPGLQGPRHWLRSAPEGSRIACLMKDDAGIVQLWTVSPLGGEPFQLTRNPTSIGSAFTWSPNGRYIAHAMDNSVCVTETDTGRTVRITERCETVRAPRPEAVVFSPDGQRIAFVRQTEDGGHWFNQIFVVDLPH